MAQSAKATPFADGIEAKSEKIASAIFSDKEGRH
jgi:hypothetical protein